MPVFTRVTFKSLVFVIGLLFSLCIAFLCYVCIVLSPAWFSSTYLLFVNGAKFVVRDSCIVLSFKRCRKASEIATINAKPIGPEFSKIRTQVLKIK